MFLSVGNMNRSNPRSIPVAEQTYWLVPMPSDSYPTSESNCGIVFSDSGSRRTSGDWIPTWWVERYVPVRIEAVDAGVQRVCAIQLSKDSPAGRSAIRWTFGVVSRACPPMVVRSARMLSMVTQTTFGPVTPVMEL